MKKIDSKTLVNGILEYINSYVIPNVDDSFLKIALKTYVVSATQKTDAFEKIVKKYMKNSFIQDIFDVKDDSFDIEFLITSLQTAIDECGDLKITFPPIKFVSPQEKVLTFKSNDLADLKQVLINISNQEAAK